LGSEKLAAILRPAGFNIVTHHDWYGPQSTLIEDPRIIADCGKANTVLLTADSDLEFTFGAEIYAAKVAILILSNNNDGPARWGPKIVAAKIDITDQISLRKKPYVLRLGSDGTLTQIRLFRKRANRVIRLNTAKHEEFCLTYS
jgi:hypothetical protein